MQAGCSLPDRHSCFSTRHAQLGCGHLRLARRHAERVLLASGMHQHHRDAAVLQDLARNTTANHPSLSIDTDIRVGDASYGIEEALAQREAALVVMGTHGRSGAKRAFVGSVTGLLATTDSATLPKIQRPGPVRACVVITMRSA